MYVLIDSLSIENLYQPIENMNGINYLLITITEEEADNFPNYLVTTLEELKTKKSILMKELI
jgi:flagellar biosynthesis/type III secretory pathway chaperone